MAGTAGFNVASTLAAGLGGVIVARAVGPTVRGEYAAIMAWSGVVVTIGCMGQPEALCFYVASDPRRAREYVATSRTMMLTTGMIVLVGGLLLAPLIARGDPAVAIGLRLAFGGAIVSFLAGSYTASLQASHLQRWNLAGLCQPVLSLIAMGVLWRLRLLSLDVIIVVVTATMLLQLGFAYSCCKRSRLVPGRTRARLIRPLATYGASQIAALTPATLNSYLDQLVLSQTVPPADLGRYAIAVSLSLLPGPVVSAIGNVAFPMLAAQRGMIGVGYRLQRLAILASAVIAAAILVPVAVASYWLVPMLFGVGYRGVVPLLWVLTPGTVFLVCGKVVSDVLRGRNRPIVVAWAQGLAAVFTVILLVALLPVFGVYGAAIASTIAYGVALAAMLRYLWQMPRNSDRVDKQIPVSSRRQCRRRGGVHAARSRGGYRPRHGERIRYRI
jgi:O-antigen/teichoic acid export membrane protein